MRNEMTYEQAKQKIESAIGHPINWANVLIAPKTFEEYAAKELLKAYVQRNAIPKICAVTDYIEPSYRTPMANL
jgi:hypothetical protein